MSISVASGRTVSLNPSQSETELVSLIVKSESGKFIACQTDSLVSVFSLAQGGVSIVGSVDVNDIVDSAGPDFEGIEGTFVETVFSPGENLIFVSTLDSLVGVIKIEPVVQLDDDEDILGQCGISSRPFGLQQYTMRLATVLLFPVKGTLFAPAPECLYVVARDKRALFLIDWVNYQARATRFVIPSLLDSGDPGSPCINSVLPQNVDLDFASLETETVLVNRVLVVANSDALLLLYDNGTVRSLARSRPSEKMCVVIPSPPADLLVAENTKLAIACGDAVYVYELGDHASHTFLFKQTMDSRVTCMNWSEGFLAVGCADSLSLLSRQGAVIFSLHSAEKEIKKVILSLPMRILATVGTDSTEVELNSLNISADLFGRSFSASQSQLLLGRDSLQLYTFPSQEWRYIPCPASYVQENGLLRSACVQINPSSRYILAVAGRGFALWSCTCSAFGSWSRKEGKWEVLADKSQEDKLGEIEIFGFLSETVFFTHSTGSREIVIWSVLKRIDLDFALSKTKLTSPDVFMAASDSNKGLLVLTYEREARMDVFQLKGDRKQATYTLELIAKLPCDLPPMKIKSLTLVNNHTVLAVSDRDEVFLRTGERVCGNVDRMFVCNSIGLDIVRTRNNTNSAITSTTVGTDDVSTMDAMMDGSETSFEEDEMSESSAELGIEETFGPSSSPAMFFIGDKECKFCSNVARLPKVKPRVIDLIQKGNPLVFMQDVRGNIAVWVVASSGRFAGRLEYVVRFEEPFAGGSQILGISGEWGVIASLSNTTGHISLTSAVHPLLSVLPIEDAQKICKRLEHSPFFMAIAEMYLHSSLAVSLGLLSRIDPEAISIDCLEETSDAVCQHPLVRHALDRLLASFKIISNFPSVFGSVFAAAVRKSEPHITFPLASCGAFTGQTTEDLFRETVARRRLGEAALLLVILQENAGPVIVRERFTIPLFREALIEQDYHLAKEIAHFHFSFSKRARSPQNRDQAWRPDPAPDDDLLEQSLRSAIETVVVTHLNFLINESMDWNRLVRFSESLKLVLGDWLLLVPRQEYLDLSQLVLSFRVCWLEDPLIPVLVEGFRKAQWVSHWRALAVASESPVMVRDCLEQTKEDNSSTITESDVETLLSKYLN